MIRTFTAISLAIALLAPLAAVADTPPAPTVKPAAPVTLDVPESGAPMRTALEGLSKETGQAILCDQTVRSALGASHIVEPSLDAMLHYLKTQEVGLNYQEVYVPADKPLPTGDDLARMVAALLSVQAAGLVIPGSDSSPTITFTRTSTPAAAPAAASQPGMRAVYLVTDSSTRPSLYANGLARPGPGAVAPAGLPPWANGQTPPVAAPGTMAGINPSTLNSAQAARQAWLNQRAAARAQLQQQAQQGQQGPAAPGDTPPGN